MSDGYTYASPSEKAKMIELERQWADLLNHLISIVERNWKDKKVYAHFNSEDESIAILHVGGSARIIRKAAHAWFENFAAIKLEKLEEDKEEHFFGHAFDGWVANGSVRQDLEDALDRLLENFLRDSEKLWIANCALMKLEDVQNGFSEHDDED